MNHGSLFSGIGGFDLAAEWMGWQNIFHCEWNKFGQKVLKHYWPNAETFADITKTDFTKYANKIDILTGGFPCQPYSQAGKRLGKDDERHLWPEMLRAIREIKPTYVVGENVRGIINWSGGLVFDEVQTDLEAQGYEVQPFLLPACAVNAPHRRDRIWFIANSSRESNGNEISGVVTDSCSNGRDRHKEFQKGRDSKQNRIPFYESNSLLERGTSTDSNITGLQGKQKQRGTKKGRQNRIKQPARHICTSWQNFPTQPPICGRNDGISYRLDGITFPKWRNESIKAYGNAIVPQVAFQIFKAIQENEIHY